MELSTCLEVLYSNDTYWNRTKQIENKVEALDQLSKIGSPSLISDIIPLLLHPSKNIREKSILLIRTWFNAITSKNQYYGCLKRCEISKLDFIAYKLYFSETDYLMLLRIASFNASGYVRECALDKLGNYKNTSDLSFITYRVADWVPKIRQRACLILRSYLRKEYHLELMHTVETFGWILKVDRLNLSELYNEIMTYLLVQEYDETFKLFYKTKEKNRRILANEFCKRSLVSSDVLTLFLEDSSYLIRLKAIDFTEMMSESQRSNLLKDRSSSVRKQAIMTYRNSEHFKSLLNRYLTDKSGGIRQIARYYTQISNEAYEERCINYLKKGAQVKSDHLIGALLGLLDIYSKHSIPYILPYLNHSTIKIQKTAFYVLYKLESDDVFSFALAHVSTPKLGLRKLIINYLGRCSSQAVIQEIRTQFLNADKNLKLSLLNLLSKMGGYLVVSDLLLGTIDDDKEIRDQALMYLTIWKQNANTVYIEPNERLKEQVLNTYNTVKDIHNQKTYFYTNPTDGLLFYLR